jgi:hypothetical protein
MFIETACTFWYFFIFQESPPKQEILIPRQNRFKETSPQKTPDVQNANGRSFKNLLTTVVCKLNVDIFALEGNNTFNFTSFKRSHLPGIKWIE